MVGGTPEVPYPGDDLVGVRHSLTALLLIVLGAALIVPATSQLWPAALLPPDTGRPDYLHNLRFLRWMLVLEGAFLWLLALLVWTRSDFLRALGGDDVLESHPGWTLTVLFAVHALGVLLFLPPQQIASGDPIFTADHAAQLYRAFGARQLSFAGAGLDGYDPFVNAGTRWTLLPDSRGFEWFARAFPFIGLATVGKVWVLLVELFLPIAVWGSARLCGLGRRATWFAVALALAYWHGGRPFVGHHRWHGDYSFLLAALLSLVAVAAGVHTVRERSTSLRRMLTFLWFLLALLGFIHPLGLLIPAVPLLLLVTWNAARFRARARLALLLMPLSLMLLHGTWLLPLVRQRTQLPQPVANLQLRGLGDLFELVQQVSLLPVLGILILAAAGAWTARPRLRQQPLGMVALALTSMGLLIWGYAMPGVRRFETARFLIPGMLASCLLAGEGLRVAIRWLRPHLGTSLLLLVLVGCATWPAFAALLDTRFFYAHRVHARLDPRFQLLMERLQEAPTPGARVLFESSRRGWLTPLGGDEALEALVPVFTHRQVIGLGHPSLTRGQPDLAFREGQLAGRHFSTWTETEFAAFLHNYNVATVVAWSSGARRFLSHFSDVLEVPSVIGTIQVFDVVDWHTTLAGKASVRAGFDRIEIRDIAVEDIVLPYHWIEGMRATPAVPVRAAIVEGAPAPFMGLRAQGHRFIVLRH